MLIKSFIGLTDGSCLKIQETEHLLSWVSHCESQYSPGCHLHIRVNSVKPAPGWFLRLWAHWNRPCSSAPPLMKTGNPVSVLTKSNNNRGVTGWTVVLTPLLFAGLQVGVVHRLPDQVSPVLVKLRVVLILELGDFCLIPLADVNAPAWITTGLRMH